MKGITSWLLSFCLIFINLSSVSASMNAKVSLALAISGCQRGGFDTYNYGNLSRIIVSQTLEHRSNLYLGDNFETTQIGEDSINHIEEAWMLAAELDGKWKKLYSSYESAVEKGLQAYADGQVFGRALEVALVGNGPRINSLCKKAQVESLALAKKKKMSQKTWIIQNAGEYLPKVVRFIKG